MKKGFFGNVTGAVGSVTGAVTGVAKKTAGAAAGAAKATVSATAGAVTYYLGREEEKPMEIGTPYNFQHLEHGVNADFANRAVSAPEAPAPAPVVIHPPMTTGYCHLLNEIHAKEGSYHLYDDNWDKKPEDSDSEEDPEFDALYADSDDELTLPVELRFSGFEIGDPAFDQHAYNKDLGASLPPPSYDSVHIYLDEEQKHNNPCLR